MLQRKLKVFLLKFYKYALSVIPMQQCNTSMKNHNYIRKTVNLTPEQIEHIISTDLTFSRFVRRAISREMNSELPFNVVVVEKSRGEKTSN